MDNGGEQSSRLASAITSVQQGVTHFKTMAKRLGRQQHNSILPPSRHLSASNRNDDSDDSSRNSLQEATTTNGPKPSELIVPADGYQQVSI